MRPCAYLTMEDLSGFHAYDSLTYGPMAQLGWQVEEIPWNRPHVNWREFEAVIIRSTWDYQKHTQAFLATLEQIEACGTKLFNSFSYCQWNLNKNYLRDLQRKGIRILPTQWADRMVPGDLDRWLEESVAGKIVVKPVVGANADDTFVIDQASPNHRDAAQCTFRDKPFMVQPFVETIHTIGEFSLIYFGGQFSHAILKQPKEGDFRVQEEHGGFLQSIAPSPDLLETGQQVIDQLGETLLYARVDFVYWNDEPTLMEVELIEPSLYFTFDEGSPIRFAETFDRMMMQPVMPSRG